MLEDLIKRANERCFSPSCSPTFAQEKGTKLQEGHLDIWRALNTAAEGHVWLTKR